MSLCISSLMLGQAIISLLLVNSCLAAQAPHIFDVDQPKECAENENFCMAFCLSTNPGTVRARCGKDRASCICTTKAGHSVKVRFIEERKPVPPTRPPPMNQIQHPSSEFGAYQSHQPHEPQNPSWNAEVPQLLVCDGAEVHVEVCHRFCVYNIGATRGVCNLTDFTCSCIGVSPAVVQDVPIPAIFTENIYMPSEPTTLAPIVPSPTTPPHETFHQYIPEFQQQHYWSPITPNHPNYYYTNNQQFAPYFQQSLRTQEGQVQNSGQFQTEFHNPGESNEQWRPIINEQPNQFQVQQTQPDASETTNATPPTLTASSTPSPKDNPNSGSSIGTTMMSSSTEVADTNSNVTYSVEKTVEEIHQTHQMKPHSPRLPMQLALDKYENHRNKRSKRSYASVMSYGISDFPQCQEQHCRFQCNYSGFDFCKSKCEDGKCYCMCSPNFVQNVQKTVYPSSGKQPVTLNLPDDHFSGNVGNSVGTPPPPPALY